MAKRLRKLCSQCVKPHQHDKNKDVCNEAYKPNISKEPPGEKDKNNQEHVQENYGNSK